MPAWYIGSAWLGSYNIEINTERLIYPNRAVRITVCRSVTLVKALTLTYYTFTGNLGVSSNVDW